MSESEELTLRASQPGCRKIDVPVLADAQDGSEILFAVARLLEEKHGEEYGYAYLVRRTANAIRDITDQMQHWVVANEADPVLREIWQERSPRDHDIGAGQHHHELARRLDINS